MELGTTWLIGLTNFVAMAFTRGSSGQRVSAAAGGGGVDGVDKVVS